MELKSLVPAQNLFRQLARSRQHVTVQRQQFTLRHAIPLRRKPVQIAQQKPERVAQLAIQLRAALHQVFARRHVLSEVDRRNPKPHNLAAHPVGNVHRIHAVAQRFRHRPALLIQRPPRRRYMRVRRAPAQGNTRQQGRVEPPAMLIAALQIKNLRPLAFLKRRVCRLQFRIRLANRKPARPRIKPHIQNVCLFPELLAPAFSAHGIFRQQRSHVCRMPRFRALILKQPHNLRVQRGIHNRFLAALAHEHRDRHSPDALPADAPVRPRRNHVRDPLLAPRRIPHHLVDLFNRKLPECRLRSVRTLHRRFQPDEPLLRRPEDHRMVTAPAMRIRVFQRSPGQQRATLFQHRHNHWIRSPHLEPIECRWRRRMPRACIVVNVPAGIHAARRVKVVALPRIKIVRAMRRCRMHRARARIGRHVGRKNSQNAALQKRMLERHPLKPCSLESRNLSSRAQFARGRHLLSQRGRHNVHRRVRTVAHRQRHVVKVRMEGHGKRCRQRPWCRRPDDRRNIPAFEFRCDRPRIRRQLVAHINRRAGVHLVLHFRLGQRRAVVDAPVNRLQPPINKTLLEESVERLQRPRLIVPGHRLVRLVPASQAANSLELGRLQVNILLRVLPAGLQNRRNRHLQLLAPQLLVHLDLDRQPMAVVPRHKRRIEPRHGL